MQIYAYVGSAWHPNDVSKLLSAV